MSKEILGSELPGFWLNVFNKTVNCIILLFCAVVVSMAQVTPPGADSDAECNPDCYDLFNWSVVMDAGGNIIGGDGIAFDNNCNTVIEASIEYQGNDSTPDYTGSDFGANTQGNSPWTDNWVITFQEELTDPIFQTSALFGSSTVAFTDCDGNPISLTDISSGTVIPSGVFMGNDEIQLDGTFSCVLITISNDQSDNYDITLGTCLGFNPPPPCITCDTGQKFEYLRLVNNTGNGTGATADVELNGVVVGDVEVLFSDLDVAEDLSGTAFGAFDNDGGNFILQMNLCEDISIQQLEIIGLETQSQAWVGTGLSGVGSSAVPTGLTLVQCGGQATMAPTGNMVTNISSNCSNQGNGKYTVDATVNTLYFKYSNPSGGCTYDKATFKIASCVPDGANAIPQCPLEFLTYAIDIDDYVMNGPDFVGADANAFQVMRDANGNYFDMNCIQIANDVMDVDANNDGDLDDEGDIDANGNGIIDSGNAISTVPVSPCAEVVDIEECSFCNPPPPCNDCSVGTYYEFVNLNQTGSTMDNLPYGIVEINGVCYGQYEFIYSDLDVNLDGNGTKFGGFDNDGGTMILRIDFCESLPVHQIDIKGLEVESMVTIGTEIAGSGPSATLSGVNLTFCDGSDRMDQDNITNNNKVTTAGPGCRANPDASYTIGGSPVNSLYFMYMNPDGGCVYDYVGFSIGICYTPPAGAIPVCPIQEFTVACEDPSGGLTGTSNYLIDANGNVFDGQNCNANIPTSDGSGPVDIEVAIEMGIELETVDIGCAEVIEAIEPECVFDMCVEIPTCTSCGMNENFEYLFLEETGVNPGGLPIGIVEIEGVKIGTYDFIYSDLDVSLDGQGSTFGGLDNDGGTMVLQMDFCQPLSISELDIMGLEVESMVSVGTSISGSGAGSTLSGLNLTFCDGSDRMDQDDITNGNTVTTAGPGCGANPDATYTITPALITTLYFKYQNPDGGCRRDYVGFRLSACVAELVDATPQCNLSVYEIDDDTNPPFLAVQDENGMWFDYNDLPNMGTIMDLTTIPEIAISPCASVTEICDTPNEDMIDTRQVCKLCFIEPVIGNLDCTPIAPQVGSNFTVNITGLENMKGEDNNETDFGLNIYLFPEGTTQMDIESNYLPNDAITIDQAAMMSGTLTVPVLLGTIEANDLTNNCTEGTLTVYVPATFPTGSYVKVITLNMAPTLDPNSTPFLINPGGPTNVIPTMGEWGLIILLLGFSIISRLTFSIYDKSLIVK